MQDESTITSTDRGWVFRECANADTLTRAELVDEFPALVRQAGFTVYEPVASKKFDGPGGVTVSVIIGESSADIHTWPEKGVAHIRLFYCHYSGNNDAKAERFLEFATEYFKPVHVEEVTKREFSV